MTKGYDIEVLAGGRLAVVTLAGQIDREAIDALGDAYERAAAVSPAVVLLDFGSVEYINSTGIALIVGVLGRARAEGRQVAATGLTPHYRHVFAITRLSDFIDVYDDVQSAVADTPVG